MTSVIIVSIIPTIALLFLLFTISSNFDNTLGATAAATTTTTDDIDIMTTTNKKKKLLLVATNWKCGIESPSEADELIAATNAMWKDLDDDVRDAVELSVHPPYVFLDRVRSNLDPTIHVGSQNLYDSAFPNRGNTGATTPSMLKNLGIDRVLLGHSDRRNHLGETDDLIAEKARSAVIDSGLGLVLTLGEKREERDAGETETVLARQLTTVVRAIVEGSSSSSSSEDEDVVAIWSRIALAYEPVWAVGEGATPCDPEEAERIHGFLRKILIEEVSSSEEAANAVAITYTGSVNPENAAGYARFSQVDGFVVGRAGLDASKLGSILTTLAETKKKQKASSTDGGDEL